MGSPEDTLTSVRHVVSIIIGLLADGEFQALETMTSGRRLSAHELEQAIHEHPETIGPTPPEKLHEIDIDEMRRRRSRTPPFRLEPRRFAATAFLWTVDQEQSELSLEVILHEVGDDLWEPEIENVRVM